MDDHIEEDMLRCMQVPSITAVGPIVTEKLTSVIFLQFCLYGSWDSLGPELMHPKLKLCIQPGTRCEIFCCVLDFSFKLV